MIKAIILDDSTVRVISGSLANELEIDWAISDLSKIKELIEFLLNFHDELPCLKPILELIEFENLGIHEGANSLDLVNWEVGSLGLLSIEDHSFLSKK